MTGAATEFNRGPQETERALLKINITFHLLTGTPEKEVLSFIIKNSITALVTDFDPLSIKREWKDNVSAKINIPFYKVDAHNIVPCWIASPEQEYAAYTFRPKIMRALPEFLQDFSKIKKHPVTLNKRPPLVDWKKAMKTSDQNISQKTSSTERFCPCRFNSSDTCQNNQMYPCKLIPDCQ